MAVDELRRWLVDKGYRGDGILRIESATLAGHRLVWNYRSRSRAGGAANIERCVGRHLPGIALEVDAATLNGLDRKEGHPRFYDRGSSRLKVELDDATSIDAWVYIAVESRCSAQPEWPRREYLELIVRASKQYGLPRSHIAELEAVPTID